MKILISISLVFLVWSCHSNGNTPTKNLIVSTKTPQKILDTTPTNNNEMFSPMGNTLDSLQGMWLGWEDKNDKLIFIKNIEYEVYGTDTTKYLFFLRDSCTSENLDSTKPIVKNGQCLILKTEENNMCYYIDYLTKRRLNLMYNGRILMYKRP